MHMSNCCDFNTSITWHEIKGVFEYNQAGSKPLLAKVSWLHTPVLQLTSGSENHNVFWNVQVKLGDGGLNLFFREDVWWIGIICVMKMDHFYGFTSLLPLFYIYFYISAQPEPGITAQSTHWLENHLQPKKAAHVTKHLYYILTHYEHKQMCNIMKRYWLLTMENALEI